MKEPHQHHERVAPTPVEALPALSIDRTDVDIQIATAHRYPRSIARFKQRAVEMVTSDVEIAAACEWRLPRAGKTLTGGSIRLAEIVASAWGNMRIQCRIGREESDYITVQAAGHDLENNEAISIEKRRRIRDKNGNRYNDDMITVTVNAAMSIAFRDVVFRLVPRALVKPIMDAAKKTALGDIKTLPERRTRMFAAFKAIGVAEKQICEHLKIVGPDDVTLEHLADMNGIYTAIQDGETTAAAVFAPPEQPKQGIQAMRERVAGMQRLSGPRQEPASVPTPDAQTQEHQWEPPPPGMDSDANSPIHQWEPPSQAPLAETQPEAAATDNQEAAAINDILGGIVAQLAQHVRVAGRRNVIIRAMGIGGDAPLPSLDRATALVQVAQRVVEAVKARELPGEQAELEATIRTWMTDAGV